MQRGENGGTERGIKTEGCSPAPTVTGGHHQRNTHTHSLSLSLSLSLSFCVCVCPSFSRLYLIALIICSLQTFKMKCLFMQSIVKLGYMLNEMLNEVESLLYYFEYKGSGN